MVLNYYSILSKAIRGKDAAARLSLYDEARALVARLRVGPDHTEEDIAAQSDALESAISQIEADVAASYREEAPNGSTAFCRRARVGGGSQPPCSQ